MCDGNNTKMLLSEPASCDKSSPKEVSECRTTIFHASPTFRDILLVKQAVQKRQSFK